MTRSRDRRQEEAAADQPRGGEAAGAGAASALIQGPAGPEPTPPDQSVRDERPVRPGPTVLVPLRLLRSVTGTLTSVTGALRSVTIPLRLLRLVTGAFRSVTVPLRSVTVPLRLLRSVTGTLRLIRSVTGTFRSVTVTLRSIASPSRWSQSPSNSSGQSQPPQSPQVSHSNLRSVTGTHSPSDQSHPRH